MTDVAVGMLFPAEQDVVEIFRSALPADWSVTVSNGNADTPGFAASLGRFDYLVVYGNRLERRHLDAASRLRMIQKVGIGIDDLDAEDCLKRGITVAVCPVGGVDAVAEHAVTLTLSALKCIVDFDDSVRGRGEWDRWSLRTRLRQLAGTTVGIVGYGAIGQATATRMAALGAKVRVYARRRLDLSSSVDVQQCDSLEQLFDEASIVSLHVPLTSETGGMVTEDLLARLGPEGILVNTARGGVIDEEALLRVLSDGRLGFAALDVLRTEPPPPEYPLLSLPNVLVTPHIAGGGFDVLRRKAQFISANLKNHSVGRSIDWRVS